LFIICHDNVRVSSAQLGCTGQATGTHQASAQPNCSGFIFARLIQPDQSTLTHPDRPTQAAPSSPL
jgi:hypothetical protein